MPLTGVALTHSDANLAAGRAECEAAGQSALTFRQETGFRKAMTGFLSETLLTRRAPVYPGMISVMRRAAVQLNLLIPAKALPCA